MPVIHKFEHKDGQRTAVWEIKEDEYTLLEITSLNSTDLNNFNKIANPGRRLEWLAVRALVKEFYGSSPSIQYTEYGKPQFVDHTDKISISHSGKMVAIALHSLLNPGIDIEMLNPRIFKIAGRFLNEEEKTQVGAQPSVEELTLIWGAKEVMFKVYEQGGISFKDDFKINPFKMSSRGTLEGVINKNNKMIVIPLKYMQIGTYIMVETNYSYKELEKN
jgi:4'-phosphopantetheinyl transferase